MRQSLSKLCSAAVALAAVAISISAVSPDEVGVNVGRGKQTATAGGEGCTGNMDVTGNSVSAHYKCLNVTSYDPRSGQMGR